MLAKPSNKTVSKTLERKSDLQPDLWILDTSVPGSIQTPRSNRETSQVRLHANELSEAWPQEVLAAIAEEVRKTDFNRYPDPHYNNLKKIIGLQYQVSPREVLLGIGSVEIIQLFIHFLSTTKNGSSKRVLIPDPTFLAYEQLSLAAQLDVVSIPLLEDFHLDEVAMRSALDQGIEICFLARPNNPTGTLWSTQTIRKLINDYPSTIFMVDEVYLSYSNIPTLWNAEAPKNLICLSSLSKIGLAGARLGYAIGHHEIIDRLRTQQLPFHIPISSVIAAEVILTCFRKVQLDLIQKVISNRQSLTEIIERLPGVQVFPSAANMILARLPSVEQAQSLVASLEKQRILIHCFHPLDSLADCVRITVGTSSEIQLLREALDLWQSNIRE